MPGYLRDVREQPDNYAWLTGTALPAPLASASPGDGEILDILALLAEDDGI